MPDLQTNACILYSCLEVEYESPTPVVLSGHYILFDSAGGDLANAGNKLNTILWQGVDALKAQGYKVTGVTMGGDGSKSNPNMYHLVLTKP
jgi:phage-related protein